MRRILKFAGIALGSLVLLLAVGVGALYAWSGRELVKKVPQPEHTFSAPTDSASIARGEHLLKAIAKCGDCHGQDLGGNAIVDDPAIGFIYAPNLTPGQGGIGADYDDAAWERAVRHGVARDGRRLIVMPSNEFQLMSDEDLGQLVAYLKTVAPVDKVSPPSRVGPLARALYLAGEFPLFPATKVTHLNEVVPSVPADSTVEYGQYLADGGCSGCHGVTFGGGRIPGGPPDWPVPANLTPTGIGHYTQADFIRALREGVRPDGSAINPFMPVNATKHMTDVEIVAVYKYLRTVEPKPFGAR